ncbi:MAG: DUF2807 domain-containing protein [Bacteroidia bacterium]|nr:DUF2807 domain-containing protein [Bacteroidia bacterium]NND11494.1 DUF2807 domain-containing protein [Flavobacteriaceae bacterium]MBT8310362.1 DUF2807 domain-containing protein [Bacteroidia bacterium]NNK27262.1 DUF2807 domain-containing protein [Flavobacteriaceae bacterium]NNL62014.1 DUF2807 domain-containing protein [Flavobacteriaceae bacterium]
MKKLGYIFILTLLFSCSGENVPDCFQNAGSIVEVDFTVETFDKITVFERIELIIKDSPIQEVVVETGEYLLNEIEVYVEDGRLNLRNDNGCNLVRDYGITKVYVSSPNLTEIRNASGQIVSSDGVLDYEMLTLISEDFRVDEGFYHTDGDFDLEVNSNSISINTNDISNVFMKGTVNDLNIRFFSGDGRFEGSNLIAQNINIFHRGSNDMIINPQQSLTGEIRSTGNVISVNQPPIVDVEEFYTGTLIFN